MVVRIFRQLYYFCLPCLLGITEVRLLQMDNKDFFSKMIYEHHFVHNFDNIYSCNLHDLLLKDGVFTDVSH